MNNTRDLFSDKKITRIFSGPTYSNNLPHFGTIFNIILKDQIIKLNNVLQCENNKLQHGFDMHGLPISNIVLKEKFNNVKPSNITEFYFACKKHAEKYSTLILEEFKCFGVTFDEKIYYTNDNDYINKELEVFSILLKKGYIKYDFYHVQTCISCKTNISFSEIEKSEREIETFFISFPVLNEENTFFLIWTTTWYSIPFSQALCVDIKKRYVKVERDNKFFYVSENFFINNQHKYSLNLIKHIDVEELTNKKYINTFYNEKNQILCMEETKDNIGTEIINMSSDHSQIDFELLQKYNIKPRTNSIDKSGVISINNKNYNKEDIFHTLEKSLLIFDVNKIKTVVETCERCKEIIITSVENQLFIDINKNDLKNTVLDSIKYITQIPNTLSLYQTISNRKSWCISRQKEWGVFIPSFICRTCNKKFICKKVLEEYKHDVLTQGSIIWLTKKYQSKTTCCDNNIEQMKETFDVWFDSSIAPIYHNKPIDIVIEGNDQYKGWFQVCLFISQAIREDISCLKILCHGFIKDEFKNKLSKSKGNFVNTKELRLKYGVDVIRTYCILQDFKNDIVFSEKNIEQAKKEYDFFRNHFHFIINSVKKYIKDNTNVIEEQQFSKNALFQIAFFDKFEEMKIDLKNSLNSFQLHMIIRKIKIFTTEYSNKIFINGMKKIIFKFNEEDISNIMAKESFFSLVLYIKELNDLIYPIFTELSNSVSEFIENLGLSNISIKNNINFYYLKKEFKHDIFNNIKEKRKYKEINGDESSNLYILDQYIENII